VRVGAGVRVRGSEVDEVDAHAGVGVPAQVI
jgi:hypothetical protein